jgi:hypothetical protein
MSDEEPYLELVRTCTKIALRCLEHDRYKRPTIGQIVNELNEKESIMQFPQASSIDGGSSIDQVQIQNFFSKYSLLFIYKMLHVIY